MTTARGLERRFLALTALRWLPVGLVFGMTVLLPIERGLELSQVGALIAIQGVVVLVLEIPTAGLSDTVGRRPVLLAAAAVGVAALVLFVIADAFWMFALSLLLQGVFRALDSGPLEAWFVDAALCFDATAPIERALGRAGSALGVAIAGGALAGGGLVAWHPLARVDPSASALVLPFVVAIAAHLAYAVAIAVLVHERAHPDAARPDAAAHMDAAHTDSAHTDSAHADAASRKDAASPDANPQSAAAAAAVPAPSFRRVVVGGMRTLAASRVMRALVLVEVFWALAMVGFETLAPARLATQVGGEDAAAALFAPASAVAWALFALGALAAERASRRLGVTVTAMIARVLNGVFVVVMGLAAGPVGLLAAYGLSYLTHGAAGPMHAALLHRQGTAANRTLALSLNSMIASAAFSVGALVLTSLGDLMGTGTAIVVAGAASILGVLCYLPALRQERGRALASAS